MVRVRIPMAGVRLFSEEMMKMDKWPPCMDEFHSRSFIGPHEPCSTHSLKSHSQPAERPHLFLLAFLPVFARFCPLCLRCPFCSLFPPCLRCPFCSLSRLACFARSFARSFSRNCFGARTVHHPGASAMRDNVDSGLFFRPNLTTL